MAPADTVVQKAWVDEILELPPVQLSPRERIERAKQSLSYITDWNLSNNSWVSGKAMREYFMDWDFALVGQEFAISAPSRWEFFLHRWRFLLQYFPRMNWKVRLVNFVRALGAPFVGYRHRHWPEEAYARVLRMLDVH